jgi:hypothetical protein
MNVLLFLGMLAELQTVYFSLEKQQFICNLNKCQQPGDTVQVSLAG